MNDFQDRGSVHQVVYRWEGNHGRQGTGMNAVAHSCDAERAEELGRELGPLLWVSGAAAARPSVVRTLSRDGDVLLVQRWPTIDRGGRPSTVSHVLVGGPGTLKVRQCLGLAYAGWGSREKAETVTGKQDVVECAKLDGPALRRLPEMLEKLPSVNHALTMTAAEWLRDPTQRISLLMEERRHPGWPDQSAVPVVYLGLFLLFGPWLGRQWTFATYDTADSHPLQLTSVPGWEPDSGGSGPLARVRGGKPANRRFELWAAAELVRHVLANPEADAGVPQLVDRLPEGATLDWERRRARLKEILGADRTPPAGTRIPAFAPGSRPGEVRETPAGERERDLDRDRDRDSARAAVAAESYTASYPESYAEPQPEPHLDSYADPHRASFTDPHRESYTDLHKESYTDPYPHPPHPPANPTSAPPPPPTSPPHPLQQPALDPNGPDPRALRQGLRGYRRGDVMAQSSLLAELRRHPDGLLLRELRSGELPPESMELVLDVLGEPHRVQVRSPELRHELCAEVLHHDLYFAPHGPGAEGRSGADRASRAAHLFTWAVAPLARHERHQRQLQELLYRMSRDPHPTTGNWLRQSIIEPPNGQVPDLPPVVWSRLLANALVRVNKPPHAAPPAPTAPPPGHRTTVPAPLAPLPPDHPPRPLMARISDRVGSAGCLLAGGLGFCVAGMVVVVAWFLS
ncbi:hypothetical protein ACFQ6S_41320 [Streptomyces sp. NPDC056479]|uniref:hypothetical protein n=1 Tax=Streptomyces sp. NPDC056479 TaxID=3345832 RepID=UPI00368E5E21